MTEWPLEIDGRAYEPIPENWIAAGRDDRAADGPQCFAVSVCVLRPSTLKIRYAHIRYDAVGAVLMPADDGDGGPIPSPDGRAWARSIPAGDLEPSGVLRQPEKRQLRKLWADRVDAISAVDDGDHLIADGGSDSEHDFETAELRDSEERDDLSHAARNELAKQVAREALDELEEDDEDDGGDE
jgi:hypothetical protein